MKIGNYVKITRKDAGTDEHGRPFCGMTAKISSINGAYVYVIPVHFSHELELLNNGGEFELMSPDRNAALKAIYRKSSSKAEKTKRDSALTQGAYSK